MHRRTYFLKIHLLLCFIEKEEDLNSIINNLNKGSPEIVLNTSALKKMINVGLTQAQKRSYTSKGIPTRKGIQNNRIQRPIKKSIATLRTRISKFERIKHFSKEKYSLSGTPRIFLQKVMRESNSTIQSKYCFAFYIRDEKGKIGCH